MTKYFKIINQNKISTGLILNEKNKVILGTYNGEILIYDLNNDFTSAQFFKKYNLFREKIKTISRFGNSNLLLIGTQFSGNLGLLNLDSGEFNVFETNSDLAGNRIFCSEWINQSQFITGSTYGKLRVHKINGSIESSIVGGHHSNSIFAICKMHDSYFVAGGYGGDIIQTKVDGLNSENFQEFYGSGVTIQALCWQRSNEHLAALDKDGTIYVYKNLKENRQDQDEWVLFMKFISGSGQGEFIRFSNNEKQLYAITDNEIILMDIETTGIYRYPVKDCYTILEKNNSLFIIHSTGLFRTDIGKPITKLYESFQYYKVSLLGYTNVGKSTLCHALLNGTFDPDIVSTEMKRIWDWNIKIDTMDKKITLHDFSGQKNILPAHLPLIINSDLIIMVISQRDVGTLETAIEMYDALIQEYNFTKDKIIFVQTHGDMNDTTSIQLDNHNKQNPDRLINPLTTSVSEDKKQVLGIDLIKEKIIEKLKSQKSKVQINTKETETVDKFIEELQSKNIQSISFDSLYNRLYRKIPLLKKKILSFTLRGLAVQGKIEYKKNIQNDIIYINMKQIYKAKNEILQFAYSKKGFIDWDIFINKINEKLKVHYLIAFDMLVDDDTCIRYQGKRIFPGFLDHEFPENIIEIAERFKFNFTKDVIKIEGDLNNETIFNEKMWFDSLLELNLSIAVISKKGGIFYFINNTAYCYFEIKTTRNVFERKKSVMILINGADEKIKEILVLDMKILLYKVFNIKKKDLIDLSNAQQIAKTDELYTTDSSEKIILKSTGKEESGTEEKLGLSVDETEEDEAEQDEMEEGLDGIATSFDSDEIKDILMKNRDIENKYSVLFCHEDLNTIESIEDHLLTLNYNLINKIEINSSSNLFQEIKKGIDNVSFCFLIISENFIKEPWKLRDLLLLTKTELFEGKLILIQYGISDETIKIYNENILEIPKIKINDNSEIIEIKSELLNEFRIINFQNLKIAINGRYETQPNIFPCSEKLIEEIRDKIKIAVFTAVQTERDAVLEIMKPIDGQNKILKFSKNSQTFFIGKIENFDIVLTMSGSMGTTLPNAMTLHSKATYDYWKPKIGFLVGIAFGANRKKQKVCDVLVSTQLIIYEPQKLDTKEQYRGPIPEASQILLDRMKNILDWEFDLAPNLKSSVIFGPILSGEKLINNLEQKNKLLEKYQNSIGGEMEGAGFYSSSHVEKVEWIIIKSICDWGDGTKTDYFQKLASHASVSLLAKLFSDSNALDDLLK